MSKPGGYVARRLEYLRTDPSLLAKQRDRRLEDAELGAALALEMATLRIPLPNVLKYAQDYEAERERELRSRLLLPQLLQEKILRAWRIK